MEIEFEKAKETKNTIMYGEIQGDEPPKIGSLYVQKWALKEMTGGDFPEKLKVTLEIME